MSQVDWLKERIAYLKLWLGIMIVTDVSLIGWLVGNYTVANFTLIAADVVLVILVSVGIIVMHIRIEKDIDRLKEI